MSEQKLAFIDGTYPSLMAGGVQATLGSSADDLNAFYGEDYWGKSFYYTGGHEPIHSPVGSAGGALQIVRVAGATTAQIYIENSGNDRPTTWQRITSSGATDWSDWEEIVTSEGSYSGLGAGKDANGYSFDTNYVWHNNGQVEKNTLKDGTTSLDCNDYLEEGKYEVHGDANNPAVNFPTSSLNPSSTSCDWYIQVFRRGSTYVTQVAYSVRGDGAIAIRVLSNGTWGNWQLLFDNGVAQQIPAASQTQLGGAYIFKDSDGYLNINTEQ